MPKNILISGAGIAGTTLAYWLDRYGFNPTIVERAPAFRKGGYVIDFWGIGYDVAEKMDLLPALRARSYDLREVRFVNERGGRIAGFGADIFRSSLGNRFLSILRGDLADTIYETIKDNVEISFGNSVQSVVESEKSVDVTFADGSERAFDLVVGADGLHSLIRKLAFGDESKFEKYLGYCAGAFSLKHYEPRDEGVYVCYCVPERQIARVAIRDDKTVFFFIFGAEKMPDLDYKDAREKQAKLKEVFSEIGWESNLIMKGMDAAEDLYLDSVSQIQMDAWSKGRVALVGDAAFCPSLLAGQGSALAMAGAYTLAGELKNCGDDYRGAFRSYELFLKSFVERKQSGAEQFGSWFAPRTRFGIFVRNMVANSLSIPLVARKFVGDSISDKLSLREYS